MLGFHLRLSLHTLSLSNLAVALIGRVYFVFVNMTKFFVLATLLTTLLYFVQSANGYCYSREQCEYRCRHRFGNGCYFDRYDYFTGFPCYRCTINHATIVGTVGGLVVTIIIIALIIFFCCSCCGRRSLPYDPVVVPPPPVFGAPPVYYGPQPNPPPYPPPRYYN